MLTIRHLFFYVALPLLLGLLCSICSPPVSAQIIAESINQDTRDTQYARDKLIADISAQAQSAKRSIKSESQMVIVEKSVADGLVFNGNTSYNCDWLHAR